MKRFLFFIVYFTTLVAAAAEKTALPDPFFKLAERDFTLAEAQAMAPGKTDPASLRAAVAANFPAAAAVVLCSRRNIALSEERTFLAMQETALMLSEARRKQFDQHLSAVGISLQEYLRREAKRFDNQLNEALRRWFKQVSNDRQITGQQISDYYYRNMIIFRRSILNEQQVLIFDAARKQLLQQAHSSLLQGVDIAVVRKELKLNISDAKYLEDLKKHYPQRTALDGGYFLIKGTDFDFIIKENALQEIYLPLDEKLSEAIANTLYDALAKAYLAEKLEVEFKDQEIKFY